MKSLRWNPNTEIHHITQELSSLGRTMANVLTLDNINVEGKTVLLRVDINSPLDPATKSFLDDTRIRAILPTLNRLSKAKTVLIALSLIHI